MAEKTQDKKTFKYGELDYSSDDFLRAHANYKLSFLNFAKERGLFDDESLKELSKAMDLRANAVREGKAFSADGILEGDTVHNVTYEVDRPRKYGLSRKDKYVSQDITEWAKHYMNKLMGLLKTNSTKNSDTKSWDIDKYGLSAYLTGQGLDAQEIFEKYDLRDENNPDNPRTFNQRLDLLKLHLINYQTWLQQKGFDFTKNSNEWDDSFMSDLQDLINNFDDYTQDTTSITTRLRKLGAGNAYTTAFTSDKWDLSASNEELSNEKKLKHLDAWEDYAYGNKRPDSPIYYTPYDYSTHNFNGKDATFINWYADLNPNLQALYGTYLGRDNSKWDAAWKNLMNSLKTSTQYLDKNLNILLQGTFQRHPEGFIDLGNNKYLIKDSVTDDGQGTIYDPTSGYVNTVFLGDLAGENEEIKSIYRNLAYKYLNKTYGTNYDDRPDVFSKGGSMIPKHQSGQSVIYNWESSNDAYATKAKKNNIDVNTQKEKDKYMSKKNVSVDNPNAGNLSTALWARIGYAVADLTSAVAAFVPGYGTAVSIGSGLISTLGNAISDFSDDAVTAKEAWRNLGMNLGMDILGLIPGGGSASKAGKIFRTLKGVIPTLVMIPGVANMLSNSPEIALSWKKAFDGTPEKGGEPLTYKDYMNILQVLNVVTGTSTIARNAYKTRRASVPQTDKVAVDVKDANGNRKALVFDGEDAKAFNEANKAGKAQEFIDKIEGDQKYTINEISKPNKGKFWGKDENGKFQLFHQNPLGKTATGSANTLEIKFDTRKNKYYAETGKWESDLYGESYVDMYGRLTLDKVLADQAELATRIAELRQKASTYNEKTKKASELRDQIDSDINTKKLEQINLALQIELQQSIMNESAAKLVARKQWIAEGGVPKAKQTIDNAKLEIENLNKQKIGKTERELIILDRKIAELNDIIRKAEQEIQDFAPEAVLRLKEGYVDAIRKKSELSIEIDKLQKMLDRLEKQKSHLDTRVTRHSDAYNELSAITPTTRKFNGVEYTFGETIDLTDLFKTGGSINKNKINKFLNYAKG